MCDECEPLLRRAREELYHARVVVSGLRNRTKTDAGSLSDSERRLGDLIGEIESRLNGSPRPEGAPGNVRHEEVHA